jgi:hypothetical protein
MEYITFDKYKITDTKLVNAIRVFLYTFGIDGINYLIDEYDIITEKKKLKCIIKILTDNMKLPTVPTRDTAIILELVIFILDTFELYKKEVFETLDRMLEQSEKHSKNENEYLKYANTYKYISEFHELSNRTKKDGLAFITTENDYFIFHVVA